MAITTSALNLLAFPQRWEGGVLTVRFLCLPQGDPQQALAPGLPSFDMANLQFEARLIGNLDHLPREADAQVAGLDALVLDEPPVQKAALFAELATRFKVASADPLPAALLTPPSFRKTVTASYRDLVGSRELSGWLASADDYACALHAGHASQPDKPALLSDALRWGEVLAFALRQPKLAMALGLLGQARVMPPDAAFYAQGGWVYIGLHATSDGAGVAGMVSSFAARIPPLGDDRGLYAPVLFPVDGAGVADDAFRDAERYDRGFARLVHATQGDQDGDAIRLGWDDEQVAEALNRQVAVATEAPMGTAGFRIDVRDMTEDDTWHSLQQVASVGPLALGQLTIGAWQGESVVEVVPASVSPAFPGEFWMPPYFCTWRGSSLVLTDPDLTRLHQRAGFDPEFDASRLGREQVFEPVGDKDVPLLYGHRYAFRVRMADLSRGGPPPEEPTPFEAGRDVRYLCEIAFQRHRRPGQIQVLQRPARGHLRLVIAKPALGHPELLFTGAHSFADLEASLEGNAARQREMGLPDPDVLKVHIRLEVRALQGDSTSWWPLYETERDFDAAEITLELAPEDSATLDGFAAAQPAVGPLAVPAARALRLVLTAIGRDDVGYFASEAARLGVAVSVELRAPALEEEPLLAAAPSLSSFFFRTPGADAAVPRPLARLAQELGLRAQDLVLGGSPGQRAVLGCSSALRHVLSPEGSALTLASDADLQQRWVNVLQFDIARDWSWDGLAEGGAGGLVVNRRLSRPGQDDVVELAGTVTLPRAVGAATAAAADAGPAGLGARAPLRQSTRVVFLDAVDPKPKINPAGEPVLFPTELTISYVVDVVLRDGLPAPDSVAAAVLLPITTPPVQVPRLVSAGIALSPHIPAGDYSATNQRERMLWLEFDAVPTDPGDAYFVRVLACAADPLLTKEVIAEVSPEPALPLDAEWMRFVVPDQPRDDNGLRAMQALLRPSSSGAHYLIPLPEGLGADAPELLSLFTYEVRLGHADARWSTAQGRFGPPLRVAGVQHPPPPLVCQAARSDEGIRVRAPFATPVQDGRHIRPPEGPKTRLWALLYARVEQVDASAWRNLMLLRMPLERPPGDFAERRPETSGPLLFGEGRFEAAALAQALRRHGLHAQAPLTTLVVEFHTEPDIDDPLGKHLGHARMLRVSPLIAVPDAC